MHHGPGGRRPPKGEGSSPHQVPTPQNPTNGAPLVADRRRQIDVIGAAACACVSVSSQPHGSMCRGGRRPGVGVKKGSKRGPYTKKAATKKRSQPTDGCEHGDARSVCRKRQVQRSAARWARRWGTRGCSSLASSGRQEHRSQRRPRREIGRSGRQPPADVIRLSRP